MGAQDELQGSKPERGAKRGGSRGTVRNQDRLSAFGTRGKAGGADWGGCRPEWLQAVVVNITRLGGAVTIGTSRDGGAHSLTLLLDGDKQTLWFNGDADLDAELEAVNATLETLF
jgi:hypothetical protein